MNYPAASGQRNQTKTHQKSGGELNPKENKNKANRKGYLILKFRSYFT